MILSRTLEGPPNLSLMRLEVPKVSPSYDPVGLLEELKKTPLYDAERGQWHCRMNKDGKHLVTNRYTEDQLLAVLVLSELGQCPIKESYKKLKDSQFYNKEKEFWNGGFTARRMLLDCNNKLVIHLLDLIVRSRFDRESAKNDCDNLKNSSYFDKEVDYLNSYLELLEILVVSEFNLNAGRESYLNLQATSLYDREQKQWNYDMSREKGLTDSSRLADTQLLNVLVISNFDINEAKTAYERLKKTSLYDKKQSQWNYSICEEGTVLTSTRNSANQLLAVLIEARLAKAFPPGTLLTESLPSFPDIWRAK